MRTTKKALQVKFERLVKLLGKEVGYKVGQWSMDYASCYGGYKIIENMEMGGEHSPLLTTRLKASQMEIALDMAICALNKHSETK